MKGRERNGKMVERKERRGEEGRERKGAYRDDVPQTKILNTPLLTKKLIRKGMHANI